MKNNTGFTIASFAVNIVIEKYLLPDILMPEVLHIG